MSAIEIKCYYEVPQGSHVGHVLFLAFFSFTQDIMPLRKYNFSVDIAALIEPLTSFKKVPQQLIPGARTGVK